MSSCFSKSLLEEVDPCAICLETDYDKNKKSTTQCRIILSCKHGFHISCILQLKTTWSCPICRRAINAKHFHKELNHINHSYKCKKENTKEEIEIKNDVVSGISIIIKAMNMAYGDGTRSQIIKTPTSLTTQPPTTVNTIVEVGVSRSDRINLLIIGLLLTMFMGSLWSILNYNSYGTEK